VEWLRDSVVKVELHTTVDNGVGVASSPVAAASVTMKAVWMMVRSIAGFPLG
jgi:hypothetical protein